MRCGGSSAGKGRPSVIWIVEYVVDDGKDSERGTSAECQRRAFDPRSGRRSCVMTGEIRPLEGEPLEQNVLQAIVDDLLTPKYREQSSTRNGNSASPGIGRRSAASE